MRFKETSVSAHIQDSLQMQLTAAQAEIEVLKAKPPIIMTEQEAGLNRKLANHNADLTEQITLLKLKISKAIEKYQDLAELYHVMTNSKDAPQDAYNHRVALEKELSSITIDSIKRGE